MQLPSLNVSVTRRGVEAIYDTTMMRWSSPLEHHADDERWARQAATLLTTSVLRTTDAERCRRGGRQTRPRSRRGDIMQPLCSLNGCD